MDTNGCVEYLKGLKAKLSPELRTEIMKYLERVGSMQKSAFITEEINERCSEAFDSTVVHIDPKQKSPLKKDLENKISGFSSENQQSVQKECETDSDITGKRCLEISQTDIVSSGVKRLFQWKTSTIVVSRSK